MVTKWEFALELVWQTPCGLYVDGRSVAAADTSYMGVDYCPENGNPLLRCPYDRKDCEHIPDGLRGKFPWCPCRLVEGPYDYERSAEKVEHEADRRRQKQYMEITGGQYCACVVGCNGYDGGLVEVKYDIDQCIRCSCKNEFCSIRKQERDLKKVNVFYDVRRTYITRVGIIEDTRTELTKGVKVFPHPFARTDAEIWLATKKAKFDPIRDKHIISPRLNPEDRRMEYFSKHHRTWPRYDYFEFHYEVENIRIEARETRDLLQDLQDVANGLTVVHDSDLKAAAKKKKSDARKNRAAAKERSRKRKTLALFQQYGNDPQMEQTFRSKLGNAEYERLIEERKAKATGIGRQLSFFDRQKGSEHFLMDIIARKLLEVIDGTEDGVLSLDVLRWNDVDCSFEVSRTIDRLIADGVLVQRPSYLFSAERAGNTKSRWGEQNNFNQYIHLKKDDYLRLVAADHANHARRLKFVVFNDIQSCINSQVVPGYEEGEAYFNRLYDKSLFSYSFVIVGTNEI